MKRNYSPVWIKGACVVFFSFILLFSRADVLPDSVAYSVIRSIGLEGNKQTRASIIFRELNFHVGDTVLDKNLGLLLKTSRDNVFNTRLFNFVTFDTSFQTGHPGLDITIHVVERWYILPLPYLEISDRNFNAWWETRDFSRLTYGVDLTFSNARGKNETLTLLTHFGFNQLYGFSYRIPYINRKQTLGVGFGADAEFNHEVVVQSAGNKPVYYKDPSLFPKELVTGYLEFVLRPNIYSFHTFQLGYDSYYLQDTLLRIPGFSLSQANHQQFVSIYYQYKMDHRDVQYYPLKGYYFDVEFSHSIPYAIAHNTYIKSNLRKFWQIYNRWYFASGLTLKFSMEKQQPYYLQRGLGYGREYVRGYEYYIIDGQHFILSKNNVKFALIPPYILRLPFLRSSKFNTVPLALYLNIFADLGYVYHYDQGSGDHLSGAGNTLQNVLLVGYGAGLDFTTYYDVVIRCEFAMNLLGKPGLYLHFLAPI